MHPEDKLSTTTSSPTRPKHLSALRPGRTATFTMIFCHQDGNCRAHRGGGEEMMYIQKEHREGT